MFRKRKYLMPYTKKNRFSFLYVILFTFNSFHVMFTLSSFWFSLYYVWTAIFLSHVSVHVPQNSKRLRSTAIYGLSGGLAAILRVEFIIFLFYFFLTSRKFRFYPKPIWTDIKWILRYVSSLSFFWQIFFCIIKSPFRFDYFFHRIFSPVK